MTYIKSEQHPTLKKRIKKNLKVVTPQSLFLGKMTLRLSASISNYLSGRNIRTAEAASKSTVA